MIGIFDSGIGGLTVLRALHAALPQKQILYLADFGYSPYGERSEEDILQRSYTILNWMKKKGVSLVVIACHTSSSVLTHSQLVQVNLPVVSMLQPTIDSILWHAQQQQWKKGVGLLATTLSIQKGTLVHALRNQGFSLPIHPIACPELAPLIESCQWNKAAEYAQGRMKHAVDAWVYGCTHYPLVEPWLPTYDIDATGTMSVPLRIDPAAKVAARVKILQTEIDLERDTKNIPEKKHTLVKKWHSDKDDFWIHPMHCADSCDGSNPVLELQAKLQNNDVKKEHNCAIQGHSNLSETIVSRSATDEPLFYYTGNPKEGALRLAHHWTTSQSIVHTTLMD